MWNRMRLVGPRLARVLRKSSWTNRIASLVLLLTLVAAAVPDLIAPFDPVKAVPVDRMLGIGVDGHLLGTDAIGRDIFSRLVYGSRAVWTVALAVSAGSLLLGSLLGATSGYIGGAFDAVVSRAIDGVLAFPPVLLGLVLAGIAGPGTWTAIAALAVVFTPLTTRVMRASVLAERGAAYVHASAGLGHRPIVTLVREVLPNTIGPMIVVTTLIASRAIIVEASLSFLGVGTQPPQPSWGLMAAEAQQYIFIAPGQVLIPVLTLAAVVLSLNFIGDAMAEVLDPESRSVRVNTR